MVNSFDLQGNFPVNSQNTSLDVIEGDFDDLIANPFDNEAPPIFPFTEAEEIIEDDATNSVLNIPENPINDPIISLFSPVPEEEIIEDDLENLPQNSTETVMNDPISQPFDPDAPSVFDFTEETEDDTFTLPETSTESVISINNHRVSQTDVFPTQSQVETTSSTLPVQQKFEKAVREKNFFEAFLSVIHEAVQLKILTVVEDENDPLFEDNLSLLQGQPGKRMATFIELLSGDIKNVIGSRFLENNHYQEILNFHREQVEEGQQIIEKNIESLRKILIYLMELQERSENLTQVPSFSEINNPKVPNISNTSFNFDVTDTEYNSGITSSQDEIILE